MMDQAITWGEVVWLALAYVVPVLLFAAAPFALDEWKWRQRLKWQRLADATKDTITCDETKRVPVGMEGRR